MDEEGEAEEPGMAGGDPTVLLAIWAERRQKSCPIMFWGQVWTKVLGSWRFCGCCARGTLLYCCELPKVCSKRGPECSDCVGGTHI